MGHPAHSAARMKEWQNRQGVLPYRSVLDAALRPSLFQALIEVDRFGL
jgi:hypothetical protein